MVRAASITGLVLAVGTALWAVTTVATTCTSELRELVPCFSFVQGGSPSPSSACCTGLGIVSKTQSQCLCPLLNSSASKEAKDRAFALLGLCSIDAPSPTNICDVGSAPPPRLRAGGDNNGGSSSRMTMGALFSAVFFGAASSIFVL